MGVLNGSISSGTGLLVTILLIKTFGMDFLRAISLTFLTVGIFWNFTGAVFLSTVGPVPYNLLLILIIVRVFGAKLIIRQKNFYLKYLEHLLMEKSLFRLSLAAFCIKISLKNVDYLLNLLELEKMEIL